MRGMRTLALLGLGIGLASGCYEGPGEPTNLGTFGEPPADDDTVGEPAGPRDDDADPDADGEPSRVPGAEELPLSTAQVRYYLSTLAPALSGRSLTYEENAMIEAQGEDALVPLIDAWTTTPGFAEAMRDMVSTELAVSGERDGVDFELPGNLVAQVVRDGLPWSTILTADYCVDAVGAMIECYTGAPYEAGVLATRAFLITNKGRFNLGRAKRMLEVFACRGYPMEPDIQIPLEKDIFIPMFQAQTAEEQTEAEADGGFGNGAGCYTCHSQFGAHAQLFVKYDENGLWQADATGLQDESEFADLGRSMDGLYASHFVDPLDAANERSWVFGEEVANVREAAEVMADHPLFFSCASKNLIGHAFGLLSGTSDAVDPGLLIELAEDALATTPDPTARDLALTVFTNEEVIRAAAAGLE